MEEEPGKKLSEAVAVELKELQRCGLILGNRMKAPLKAFTNTIEKVEEFLNLASVTVMPAERDDRQKMLNSVAESMEVVSEFSVGVLPEDTLEHHLRSLEGVVKTFVWLLSSDPLSTMKKEKEPLMEMLRPLKQKGVTGDPVHVDWANALESIYDKIEGFVITECPEGVVWKIDTEP
ncbi:hypothetical protein NDN08_003576 [Rhodosorus marinus]|uniref:CAP N-terminal domain-containing protein n=1 Tax=Rhodosorus marinus TaxID=101924 RepID=A0AAV8UX68_9RHOD|nr:hypothetical protein NDN08_003576 [Rhodosorus marinus]